MLSEKKKQLLKEFVDNKCEICKKEKPLEIHRINRGNNGGTYTVNNLKILCKSCHRLIHANEFK